MCICTFDRACTDLKGNIMDEHFADPVLELARRTGGDVFDLAATDEEASQVLEVLDEVDAELEAGDLAARLRRGGQLW